MSESKEYVDGNTGEKLVVTTDKDTQGNPSVTVVTKPGTNKTVTTEDEDKIKQIITEKDIDITNAAGNDKAQVEIVYNEFVKNMDTPFDAPTDLKESIENILNSKPPASTGTTTTGTNVGGKAKRSKKSAKKGKKSRGMKGKRGRRSAKKGRK